MTELFRNNSPGALTLEQARELEIKRHRERRRQAEQLAAQGRGEDTEIAHVALGEVVVPEALQTPEFMEALGRAAEAQGVSIDQLRVGNYRNSINPSTGAAEFSYPGLLPDGNRRDQVTGRQVADLTINYFPEAANRAGHVGIGVNTNQTKGFYPQQQSNMIFGGVDVPGLVKRDDLTLPHEKVTIHTTPEQDARAQAFMDGRQRNPGNYDLYNRQCTDFVSGTLRAAGVEVPSDLTSNPIDNMLPRKFFPRLKDRYGH